MILIGLTGSIGMGKSATSAMFRKAGLPVYDADAAVHRLYAGPAVEPVGALFPDAIVGGRVDRGVLSKHVVHDRDAMKRLEAIVHPLVARDRIVLLQTWFNEGARACVLDVPLLFETGGERGVDVIVVVSAGAQEQERRVLARQDMTREKFEAIRNKQMPDAEKRKRAHFTVDSGQGFDYARRQVRDLLLAMGI